MTNQVPPSPFFHFRPPYRTLEPVVVGSPGWNPGDGRPSGELLVWRLVGPVNATEFEAAGARPAGVALIVILPPSECVSDPGEVLRIIELCQPHTLLPHHERPSPFDLQALLRQPPEDLPGETLDYLGWRGIVLDHDTRHIVRRTLELSAELRTVSALSRSLYLSRRALGRRFLDRGIPVPSHWLHFGRVLRACLRLQSSNSSLFDVACDMGYPDGFALSNQMHRLFGIRPSQAREHLGWEWLLEAWLKREALTGGFALEYTKLIAPSSNEAVSENGAAADSSRAARPTSRGPRSSASARAEQLTVVAERATLPAPPQTSAVPGGKL